VAVIMGSDMVARMLAELPWIPEEAQGLALKLADLVHDKEPHPCAWPSPKMLTAALYGRDNAVTRRRFVRRMEMLTEAGVVMRARGQHEGRPKSRQCPRDGRKFHVEVLPVDDAGRRLIATAQGVELLEVDDAGRRPLPETRRRPAVKVDDVGRRALSKGRTSNGTSTYRRTSSTPTSVDGYESSEPLQTHSPARARAEAEGIEKILKEEKQRRDAEPACATCGYPADMCAAVQARNGFAHRHAFSALTRAELVFTS
jgi:hypothetical protein